MCGKKTYFPLFVDISKKKIVVIGGGKVAERRVETLLNFSDDITVISPKVTEGIRKRVTEEKVSWIPDAIRMERGRSIEKAIEWFSEYADMVFAATDNSTCNEQLVRICREQGILVNASHKKELCDFYFPAVVVKDGVTVGITSGGEDHAQAKKIREQIEAMLLEQDIEYTL